MPRDIGRLIDRLNPTNRAAALDYLTDQAEDQQLEREASKSRVMAFYMDAFTATLSGEGRRPGYQIDPDCLAAQVALPPALRSLKARHP